MTQQDIKRLQKIHGYPCISLFIPTHRTMPDRTQDPVRVKEHIRQAVDLLLKEFSQRDVEPFVTRLNGLAGKIDYTKDRGGLILFVNKDTGELYDMPFSVPEKIVIDDNFYTRPLIRAISRLFPYRVLTLGKKKVRLLRGANSTLTEITDSPEACAKQEGFPFEWQWEVTSDRIVQSTQEGLRDASYKTAKEREFFQQADHVLEMHCAHDNQPLIVVGPEELCGAFKKATKHTARIIAYVACDCSRASREEIAETIAPALQAHMTREKQAIVKDFLESIGAQKAAAGMSEVWLRTYEGRVRILLIEDDFTFSGFKNQAKPEEIVPCQDKTVAGVTTDLVDDLIELVLSKDGTVVFIPADALKNHGHVGAILRY